MSNFNLVSVHPKLPMRNINKTKDFYIGKLGFTELADYGDYLILAKDSIEIHFFEFKGLDIDSNYGQVYIRTKDIADLYQSLLDKNVRIHPNAPLETKPWGQKEFCLVDADNNLITFGQLV